MQQVSDACLQQVADKRDEPFVVGQVSASISQRFKT